MTAIQANNGARGGRLEDHNDSDGGEEDEEDEEDEENDNRDNALDDEDEGDSDGVVGGASRYGRTYARLGGPFIAISDIVEVGLAHESDCDDWTAGVYKGPLKGDPRNLSASGYTSL